MEHTESQGVKTYERSEQRTSEQGKLRETIKDVIGGLICAAVVCVLIILACLLLRG